MIGTIGTTAGVFAFLVDSLHCLGNDSQNPQHDRCHSEMTRLQTRDGIIAGAGFAVLVTGAFFLGIGLRQPTVTLTERERSIAQRAASFAWRMPEPSRVPASSAPSFPLINARF